MNFDLKAYQKFYKSITGFAPYAYQAKVAEYLQNGKNVILSVPTGAGKTWASIMPFLFARNQSDIDFPSKMIYSLPLRALCNSIYMDVTKAMAKHCEFRDLAERQTGEFSNDKYFEHDIVFSTIDQTLSNFLCFPLALSQRQANINAGALIGSYLVFDEFHLLDGERSMATTLGMLRMLKGLSRFCIMTATLSDEFMNKIKEALENVEIVTLEKFENDVAKIGSLQIPEGKLSKKEIEIAEGIIRADHIVRSHNNKTIVICNRVETAQRVYLELEDWAKKNDTILVCLHSRFFDTDRKMYEGQLKMLFGKNSPKNKNAILIATQVIEAGMDISCEVMHTEVAPINALLQRVGRCARYSGEHGKVFVYDVLSIEERLQIEETDFRNLSKEDKKEIRKLQNKYLPYDEGLCKTTLEKLKLPGNQLLNEEITIRLVNEILTKTEQTIIDQLQTTKYNFNKIKDAWRDCSKSHYRQTIRDIQSIDAVIIRDKSIAEKYPYSLESISVFKWSLVKWIKEILDTVDTEEDWVVGVVEESNILGFDLDEGEAPLSFREINDIDGVIDTFETLCLNVKYFQYDKFIGFNKNRGDQFSAFKERKEKDKEIYAYRKDTFIQHTKGLLGAFDKEFLPSTPFIFKAFNQIFNSNIKFKKLIQLILILHDYGKLDAKWQGWMQEYQKELSLMPNSKYTYEEGVPLGHTGFNTRKEKECFGEVLEKATKAIEDEVFNKRGKRPPHAGVGAKVILEVLDDWFENDELFEKISIPASIAIARHHGVTNFKYPDFAISSHNYQFIKKVLIEYEIEVVALDRISKRGGELTVMSFGEFEEYLLYLFLVRILRLCDQKATDDFEKYLN